MHFSTITSLAAAALIGTANAVATPVTNPHISDFRLYGVENCDQTRNLGVWTVQSEDFTNGSCQSLRSQYKSVILENINDGCQLTLYETADCSSGAAPLTTQVCSTATGTTQYLAWSMSCEGHQ